MKWIFRTLILSSIVCAMIQASFANSREFTTNEHIALPTLPEPVSNNAVASISVDDRVYLLSFMGLGEEKTHKDVHSNAFSLDLSGGTSELNWQALPDVPASILPKGRLASVAIGINDTAYLFGGYTVDAKHNEISSPDNFSFDIRSQKYTPLANMAVPVDDAVAAAYKERFIYIISGWHNDGNVNLVQVYDTHEDTWRQATPFPGEAVFGHSGGIVNNSLIICDGVKVEWAGKSRRQFLPEPACFRGEINHTSHLKITWRKIKHPTGKARYRMAAIGSQQHEGVFFYGGSNTPYNYNGIGYDGNPAAPSSALWFYDLSANQWTIETRDIASMDHRAALLINNKEIDPNMDSKAFLVTVGGMHQNQTVTSTVNVIEID